MYKKTQWKRFERRLSCRYSRNVPDNTNLSNSEIIHHLNGIKDAIHAEIEATVPRHRPRDNILVYTNGRIRSLHKDKSSLVTSLNRLLDHRDRCPDSLQKMAELKALINTINKHLKSEYDIAYNKYWDGQKRKIDHRKPEKFFPVLNRLFRPRGSPGADLLEVKTTDTQTLERAGIDLTSVPVSDGKIEICTPSEILNTMGAYLERINFPRHTNVGTAHRLSVDTQVATFNALFQSNHNTGSSITVFDDDNPATWPRQINGSLDFTNFRKVRSIFKALPNKTSSGPDNIPPLVLKHIPVNMIRDYTIIFNNCLNNRFYPEPWKKARVFPILKKDRPRTDVSSFRPISLTLADSKAFEVVISQTLARLNSEKERRKSFPQTSSASALSYRQCMPLIKY